MLTDDRGEQIAVQCKQWSKWDIGVPKVRELVGAMTDAGIRKARLVTVSGYSHPAKELADPHNIEIVNQAELIRMLEALSGHSDPEIQALLTNTRKFCPKCDSLMVVRTTKRGENTGRQFWGCFTYPSCKQMEPI